MVVGPPAEPIYQSSNLTVLPAPCIPVSWWPGLPLTPHKALVSRVGREQGSE